MIGLSLAVSAALVLLNGLFVGFEFAIVKASPHQLDAMAASGNHGAALARHQKEHVNDFLAVCQLGITLVTLALTIAFEPAIETLVGPILHQIMSETAARAVSLSIALFIATSIHVTFGELIPKSLALISPETLVSRAARAIEIAFRLGRPLIWLFNTFSTYLARTITGKPVGVDAEEIDVRQALRESHESGQIDVSQYELLDAVLEFPERTAREVMTPRSEVAAVDLRKEIEDNLGTVGERRHTRYPVISDDGVEGYVIVHDLFEMDAPRVIDWQSIMRRIPKVPETLTLPRLQEAMRDSPMAAVFDEYNEFVGIVTGEDINEEIIGDLFDEDDEVGLPTVQEEPDGTLLVSGTADVEDVLDAIQLEVDEDDLDGVDTFGGLLLTHLGREPADGDELELPPYHFTIEETHRFRIVRVRARRMIEPPSAAPNGDSPQEGGEPE